MKKYSKLIYALVAVIGFSGCLKDEINLPNQNPDDYNLVYMPQAVNTPLVSTIMFNNEDQFLVYGAGYGGLGYSSSDIPVNFVVSPDSVAAFNQKNKTNYPMMPSDSYTLSSPSSIIPKGQLSTQPLKIKVKTEGALDLFKEYLLPVTVSVNSGNNVKLNKSLSTAYFLVKASLNLSDFPEFNKAEWQLVSFSSEELNGEGANNGKAVFAIDNKVNTYWHTRYSDSFANPPHILVVDMKTVRTVHGVSFVARQNENRGRPMEATVETSINGIDWMSSENFNLQSTNDQQRLFFLTGFKEARYLRLTITKMYDNATHTHLAEFGAF